MLPSASADYTNPHGGRPIKFNPILIREVRARWRKWSAFGVLLLYAVLLAAAMIYIYATFAQSPIQLNVDATQQMKEMSHRLFSTITCMQILIWMLIAPSLTAPAIAGERERGLLESLQLSEMAPQKILLGKLASTLSFITLLLVVSLPVTSVCFLFGGLAPVDFVLAVVLQLATILTSSAVGLYFSARSHRTFGALRATFLVMVFWGCGSAWAADNAWYALRAMAGTSFVDFYQAYLLALFGYSNPLLAAISLTRTGTITTPFPAGSIGAATIMASLPQWAICIALQMSVSVLLLYLAARALRKPLPTPRWVERKRWLDRLRAVLVPPERAQSTPHATQPSTLPRRELRQRAGKALMREFPVERLARFANPVLQREVRSKFRLRQGSTWMLLLQILITSAVVTCYLYAGFLATDPPERAGTWVVLSRGGLIAVILVTAIMGAGAFSREREAGTWESLSLSLLSPREIIFGKLLTPLVMCAYGFVLFLPVLLPCALLSATSINDPSGDSFGAKTLSALATVLVVAGAGWCCTAWGLLLSWLCRRTAVAISWTLVTLAGGLIVLPTVSAIALNLVYRLFFLGFADTSIYGSGWDYQLLSAVHMLNRAWNPWLALGSLQGDREWSVYYSAVEQAPYWATPLFVACVNVM
ncbi:MAG TPA: ABC transporter permease subunit, partial [Abditibacteriaceae bacterium]|nr:ABC transporter permease subunit [Abditibacteriaceae bacterium]